MLKRLVLAGLAAWAAAGFLQEVNGAVAGWDGRGREDGGLPWRFGAREPAAPPRTLEAAPPAPPPPPGAPRAPGGPCGRLRGRGRSAGEPPGRLALGGLPAAGARRAGDRRSGRR